MSEPSIFKDEAATSSVIDPQHKVSAALEVHAEKALDLLRGRQCAPGLGKRAGSCTYGALGSGSGFFEIDEWEKETPLDR